MHLHISQHTFTPFHSHSPTHPPPCTLTSHSIHSHPFTVTAPHMHPQSHLTKYFTCNPLPTHTHTHTHTQNKAPPHVEGELLKQNTKAIVGKKGWKKYFFIVSQSFFIQVAMTVLKSCCHWKIIHLSTVSKVLFQAYNFILVIWKEILRCH